MARKKTKSPMTEGPDPSPTPVPSKPPPKGKRAAKSQRKLDGTCFVLMPFKEPFDTYYRAILEPAVEAAGLEPLRGDSLFRPSPIMADIWRMIQDAKVIVAELTEKNANVFYELGLAHAIGKPVVMIAESISDVPFDLQSLRVILYDKNDPAWGKKLKNSIAASVKQTLGDTTSAVPSMFRKVVKSQAPTERESNSRIDVLERQVAALEEARSYGRSRIRQIRDPHELRDRLDRAGSRQEAIDFIRSAFEAGMSPGLIEKVASDALPPTVAKELVAEAIRRRKR